jgi:putative spermidine/putrescine transport system substrate-binding protein
MPLAGLAAALLAAMCLAGSLSAEPAVEPPAAASAAAGGAAKESSPAAPAPDATPDAPAGEKAKAEAEEPRPSAPPASVAGEADPRLAAPPAEPAQRTAEPEEAVPIPQPAPRPQRAEQPAPVDSPGPAKADAPEAIPEAPEPAATAIAPPRPTPVLAPPAPQVAPGPQPSATTPPPAARAKPGTLRIAVPAGAYGQAQERAILAPWRTQGHTLSVEPAPRDPAQQRAALLRAGQSPDVAEVEASVADSACKAGLLEPLAEAKLAPSQDGRPAREDFLPGALTTCGVAGTAYSSLVVFDRQRFPRTAPATLRDVFDIRRFPGNRVFRRSPRHTLELALMADGVAPAEVYKTLATEEGLVRALGRLEVIREFTLWTDGAADTTRLLAQRSAAIAVAYSGRAFQEIAVELRPYGAIWDGQIVHYNIWVVPKAAGGKDAALQFVAFATEPARLAAQARLFPYGPARKSAAAQVGRHGALKSDLAPYLPTAAANLATALVFDGSFWAEHEARIGARFEAWLTGEDAGPAAPAVAVPGERPREPG